MRPRAFPENRHIARIAAECPDIVVHPLQSQHHIAQEQVPVDGVIAVGQ
ncbi:Uncharacterised protein [Mycobacteroides abscessus subsp. abscessus]|nr:Uncharacterised protein [Mycobacteroides abscessus subsp. abscessus]SKU00055.1 Uncharacterised protein [Mycobacteroides abscessus subsp. abscessus]